MNLKGFRHAMPLTALILLTFLSTVPSRAQDLTEELIFKPIETVITAGRTEQRIERAPATVTVISSEEIRASGALNIPELLRLVPGLDVTTVSSSHFEVNARGLNQILSNKMLVLIDGRSAYFDFFGGVIWQALQIVIDQIDRIEIVRSPSSSLYGANAFSGVINIITKNARQINGTKVNLRVGEQSTLYTSVMHGQRYGDTSLRFVLGSRQMDSFGEPARDFENNILGNVSLEHRFGSQQHLTAEAGVINGTVSQKVRLLDNEFDATTSYAKVNYEHGDFSLQGFWNRGDETGDPFFQGTNPVDILYNTFDIEAQQKFEIVNKHTLIAGGTYRYNTIKSNVFGQEHDQNLLAAYFQEEYRPIPEVSLLGGGRIDHHPLVGTSFSPRGSIIYSPVSRHTFRVSVGRAFRNPSFTDSYFQLQVPIPPLDLLLVGKSDLESEKITTYELGYTFFPRHFFRAEIDLFAYKFNDYIGVGHAIQEGDKLIQSFLNYGSATNYGFEATLDVLPCSRIKLSTNYSYQNLTNHYSIISKQLPPHHKFNIKSFISLPHDFSAYLALSHVGESSWEIPNQEGLYDGVQAESNTRVDARVAWSARARRVELFVAAYNLLDSRYREYPLGEEIRRRFTSGFLISF